MHSLQMLSQILYKKNPVSFIIQHKISHMIIKITLAAKITKRSNAFESLSCARHCANHFFTQISIFNSNENPLNCDPIIVFVL